ncbi:hypothetical protein SAMN05216548_11459 [Faunimonas pinastri]|uniref:Uncharacterized protein n=1 Tax=Faunimonas pinastri TaxID=1855383 RepID=A0A1H9MUT2_9HYPH|nr:hypothetical protein [Faunimonas pinastri]SER27442.1 hypothetical protein SAMN05216548_11459 [Faunimonas pinastri]
MTALLNHENVTATPIEEGDAGIILKPDGTFKVFSTGLIDGANLTTAQQEQGKRLMALSVALAHPQVMDILLQMAADPDIVGEKVVDTKLSS